MSGLVSLMRRASGTGVYVPPPFVTSLHSFNATLTNTYHSNFCFNDIVKNSEKVWQGASIAGGVANTNGDGWVTAFPNAGVASLRIAFDMTNFGYLQPGAYRFRSTSGCVLSVAASAGITQTHTAVNLCEFTVDGSGGMGVIDLRLKWTNGTGGNVNISDGQCYLISDEAAVNAGLAIKQVYVDALTGAKVIRMHDFCESSAFTVTSERYFSAYNQNRAKRCWSGDASVYDGIKIGMVPISVCCELADRAGARPWFNTPVGMGQYPYYFDWAIGGFRVFSTYAESGHGSVIPHGFAEGDPIYSYSFDTTNLSLYPFTQNGVMYAKNVTLDGGLAFKVSATPLGAAVAISSAAAKVVTTGNLSTNSLVITGIPSTTGVAIGSVVYCANLYAGVGIVQTVDSGTQVTLKFLDDGSVTAGTGVAMTFNGDVGSGMTNRYSTVASTAINMVEDMIRPWMQAVQDYRDAHPTMLPPMYEPENEVWNTSFPSYNFFQRIAARLAGHEGYAYDGMAYVMLLLWKTANEVHGAGNFTLVHPGQGTFFGNFGESFEYLDPGILNAGGKLKAQYTAALAADANPDVPTVCYSSAYYLGGSGNPNDGSLLDGPVFQKAIDQVGSTSIPNSYWDARFASEIEWQAGNLPLDLAQAKVKVPAIKMVVYESGHQVNGVICNGDDLRVVAQLFLAYLDGADGGTMTRDYIAQVFIPNAANLYCVNHYNGAGGRTISYAFFAWPIIPGNLVDTPRSLAWKSF